MLLNEFKYRCPNCSDLVNEGEEVKLLVKRASGEEGFIYLNPKIKRYDFRCDPELSFYKKEKVSFYCPSCGGSIDSEQYKGYANLKLRVSDDIEFDVLFSRIYGKHETHLVTVDFDLAETKREHPE